MATRQFHPNLDDAQALKVYRLLRLVADIVYEQVAIEGRVWMNDNRIAMASGYDIHQTTGGLFLELYHSKPWHLWTPWGEWPFAGQSGGDTALWREVVDGIVNRLEIDLYKARYGSGTGPVYSILAVDGEELPEPRLVDGDTAVDYTTLFDGWLALLAAS